MKLAAKVSLLMLGFSLLVVLTLGWALYQRLWDDRLALIQDSVQHQISDFDVFLRNLFAEVEADLDALAQDELVRSPDEDGFTSFLDADEATFRYRYGETERRIIAIFNAYRLSHPYVNSVYMGRENGAYVRSHPRQRPTAYDPRDRPWYRLAIEHPQKARRTDPYPSVTTNDVNIGVVRALLDGKGRILGVLGIDVTLDNLTDFIGRFQVWPAGKVYLLDRAGVVLASQDKGGRGRKAQDISPDLPLFLGGQGGKAEPLTLDGVESFLFHGPTGDQGWQIAVIIPREEIVAQVRPSVRLALTWFIAALLLLGGLSLAGLHLSILGPIRKLTRETDRITRTGNLDHRITLRSGDEVGQLADSFNRMLDTLERTQESMRARSRPDKP